MILRGDTKTDAFVSAIACTIGRDAHARKDAEALTRDYLESGGDSAIYLAGGYWRAVPVWESDDSDRLFAVRLVNPDRTRAEIAIVEQGIAILCRFEYQP